MGYFRYLLNIFMIALFLVILDASLASSLFAQGNNPNPADLADEFPDRFSKWELMAAAIVLVYSTIMVGSSFLLIKYAGVTEDAVVRLMALVMLVTATLLLVVMHFRPEQIAAALGLLGTLAGYVLGRSDRKKDDE